MLLLSSLTVVLLDQLEHLAWLLQKRLGKAERAAQYACACMVSHSVPSLAGAFADAVAFQPNSVSRIAGKGVHEDVELVSCPALLSFPAPHEF